MPSPRSRRDRSIFLSPTLRTSPRVTGSGCPMMSRREPRLALVAGPTGMEVAERVLAEVRRWLAPTGEAWVEVGEDQARTLAERFSAQVVNDQYGRDRFVRIANRSDDPTSIRGILSAMPSRRTL